MITLRHPAILAAAFICLSTASSRAQTVPPVQYHLEDTSGYSEGCYPPCLCPVFFGWIASGTHVLQYLNTDVTGYDNYLVHSIDWVLDYGLTPRHVTGNGHYRRGGMAAVNEQLTLDLSVDGAPAEHFDSGLVIAQANFPRIEITISKNGMFCYDKVYYIASAPDPGLPYCFGDGSGTACPCGNTGANGSGCASSVTAAGARLTGNGTASLSADTVELAGFALPNAPLLFFQGTQPASGGAGLAFGDGLLCLTGNIARLKVVQAQSGVAELPEAGDPPLSVMGGIASPGTFEYQIWYRDAPVFCTPSTFNLTNGYEIPWAP